MSSTVFFLSFAVFVYVSFSLAIFRFNYKLLSTLPQRLLSYISYMQIYNSVLLSKCSKQKQYMSNILNTWKIYVVADSSFLFYYRRLFGTFIFVSAAHLYHISIRYQQPRKSTSSFFIWFVHHHHISTLCFFICAPIVGGGSQLKLCISLSLSIVSVLLLSFFLFTYCVFA